MIREFREAQAEMSKMKTSKEKMEYVLKDLYTENSVPIYQAHMNPILMGKVIRRNEYQYVASVETLLGFPIAKSAYEDAPLLITLGNSVMYNKSEFIVFMVEIGYNGNPRKPEQILAVRKGSCLSLAKDLQFGHSIATPMGIISRLLKIDYFAEQRESLLYLQRQCMNAEQEGVAEAVKAWNVEKENLSKTISNMQGKKKETEESIEELQQLLPKLTAEKERLENAIQDKERMERFFTTYRKNKTRNNVPILFDARNEPLQVFKNYLDYPYTNDLLIPFLTALGTTQIIVLFGKPGTGKTTFVTKAAKALGAVCTIVSVQNNWTESSDILGYYSPIDGTFESTRFIDAILDAKDDWEKYLKEGKESPLHIICLDEMNLARVEYYFADFLSLLQLNSNERWIHVLPQYVQDDIVSLLPTDKTVDIEQLRKSILSGTDTEKKRLFSLRRYMDFLFPPNVRFVGTINNDDTTNELSPKVVDRCFFLEVTNSSDSEETVHEEKYFFPATFFTSDASDFSLPDDFKNQNLRFRSYVKVMWTQFQKVRPDGTSKEFLQWMIISKILPSLRKNEFVFSQEDYPEAFRRFTEHQSSSDYYNYLGG